MTFKPKSVFCKSDTICRDFDTINKLKALRSITYETLIKALDELPMTLKDERKARGISQIEAAKQIGIGQTTLIRVEQGYGLTVDTAIKIYRWL